MLARNRLLRKKKTNRESPVGDVCEHRVVLRNHVRHGEGEVHERSEIDWSVDSVINSVVARAETITSQKLSFPGANESAGERQNMRGWGLWLR